MREKEGTGRLVTKEAHDQRFAMIKPTLELVQSAALYDKLQIYARDIVVDHPSLTEAIYLVAHNPDIPLPVYQDEIERKWPHKLQMDFEQCMEKVIQLKQARNAPDSEINEFRQQMTVVYKLYQEQKQVRKIIHRRRLRGD